MTQRGGVTLWVPTLLLLLVVLAMPCSHQLAAAALLSSEPPLQPTESVSPAPAIHLDPRPWALTAVVRTKLADDEYPPISIVHPANGSVNTLPLHFHCDVGLNDYQEFLRRYGQYVFCLEIDHEWKQCSPLSMTSPLPTYWSPGNHSVVAYMVENDSNVSRILESERVVFSVLPDISHRVPTKQRMQPRMANDENDLDLLSWGSSQENDSAAGEVFDELQHDSTSFVFTNSHDFEPTKSDQQKPVVLIIGVKTSILHGFPSRQAIRSTWADQASLEAHGIHVYFIGCQPVIFEDQHQHQREAILRAIDMEKQHFGDLLTDELECEDSYFTLPAKVKEFLHFAATKFPQVPYVMIADDDIYLRVDQLTQALRHHGPRTQFYAGQVWAQQYRSFAPVRDLNNKNHIPEAQYPMNQLPPYASGPHYFMSMDCAQYIGSNRNDLKGLSASDDVSVGLWLLAIQVHPEHLAPFQNLRDETCSDDLISLADLTPLAIRLAHENLGENAPFCRGFALATWLKPNQAALKLDFKRKVEFGMRVELGSSGLKVIIEVTLEYGITAKSFQYSPLRDEFQDLSAQVCKYLNKIQVYHDDCSGDIATQIHAAMIKTLDLLTKEGTFSSARLMLWRHNLQFALLSASQIPKAVVIMYSPSGKKGVVHVECIFASIYPHRPLKVVDEATRSQASRTSSHPDVFVFSIMDGNCANAWTAPCKTLADSYVRQFGEFSLMIMVSGEPHEIDELDERVLLMSTRSDVIRKRHVYLPMASMLFVEGIARSPTLLLSSAHALGYQSEGEVNQTPLAPRKFCAYMYAHCYWPQREYMFDLLTALEPVDALGMCQGARRKPIMKRWWARTSASAMEDAVSIYSQYKFVIAFENSQRPGYVTEKIVNAFLAGSIPIYLGHVDSIAQQLFNPRSFIDCGQFATLRECAERVMEVHQSTELYEQMLREPVIRNVTLFKELFSWHPDVPSQHLADSVAALLQQKR